MTQCVKKRHDEYDFTRRVVQEGDFYCESDFKGFFLSTGLSWNLHFCDWLDGLFHVGSWCGQPYQLTDP